MKRYVIEPSTPVDLSAFSSREEKMGALKAALEDLTRTVEDFAAQHPGRVKIGRGAWINTTLEIDMPSELAPILAQRPGIGRIEEARDLQLDVGTVIISPRPPRKKPGEPGF